MRYLIGAFGTHGDVRPMVALSRELRARGHAVCIAVPPESLSFVQQAGIEAIAAGIDYGEISRRSANGSFKEMLEVLPLIRNEVRAHLQAMEDRAAEADVLVGCSVFTVGKLLSEKLGKPYSFFAFCPQLFPSGDHPSPSIPWQRLPRWANRLTWTLNDFVWKRVLLRTLNEVRAEKGLGRIRDTWTSLVGEAPLLACEPALAAAPDDYLRPIAQVGALFFDEPGVLSPEVTAFLAAGPAPVFIGFGSMSDPNPQATTERLLEAVRRAEVRAILSRGWAGLASEAPPDGVLFVGAEPHTQLFPRCAAIVHHGGAGTTHAAARAGVPQVVMPQLLDQNYWVHRAKRAGIGLCAPRHGRDPEPLARALRACLTDEALRAKAREFAASMRLDGVMRAADFLERLAMISPATAF